MHGGYRLCDELHPLPHLTRPSISVYYRGPRFRAETRPGAPVARNECKERGPAVRALSKKPPNAASGRRLATPRESGDADQTDAEQRERAGLGNRDLPAVRVVERQVRQ